MRNKFFLLLLLFVLCLAQEPFLKAQESELVRAEIEESDEERKNSWEKLTSWLRKRKNPFRTSSSDIVRRGRRAIGTPPSDIVKQDDSKQINGKQAIKSQRFFAKKERELKSIQDAYDRENYQKVVLLSKPFVDDLGRFTAGPEYVERQQELLRIVKEWRNTAREKIEQQGIEKIVENMEKMKEAFIDEEYEELRKLGGEIKEFVDNWDFSDVEREKQARADLKKSEDWVRRANLREEFSQITIQVSFRIVSNSADIPSSATINGQSKREGDVLDEKGFLVVKKISQDSILFDYKGELIEYDME